jgi:hypothetical protein
MISPLLMDGMRLVVSLGFGGYNKNPLLTGMDHDAKIDLCRDFFNGISLTLHLRSGPGLRSDAEAGLEAAFK